MSDEVVTRLRAMCDLLKAFSNLVRRLNRISKKYNMPLNEIKNLNSFDRDSLRVLIKSLPPEKLGHVVVAVTKIEEFQRDTKNFMDYTPEELDEFAAKLASLVKELEEALR